MFPFRGPNIGTHHTSIRSPKDIRMEINIPRFTGDPLQLTLSTGDRLFIVGANGSGKSALIQRLVSSNRNEKIRRISAHRQTWFQSESLDFTPQARREFDLEITRQEVQDQARWRDQYAQQRQSAVLFDLVAKENERARLITRYIDDQNVEEANRISLREASQFDQINELLVLGTLAIILEHSKGEEILARHKNASDSFSIAQMSDGERNAALIAATVLTVEPETVLLIDEPERHLHRSIIEPFLSALFESRKDCTFVISTHEIALPVADPEAHTLVVHSCSWNDNKARAWDVDLLEARSDLPEDLKRAILGSRKRILFVEGDRSGSLDLPLYDALFPGISIVPKGGCADVLRAVDGLRGSENLHQVEAFGLIDRDNRPDDEINQLASKHVYALDVYSAEALYYCSDAIAAVAQHQAEALLGNADEMVESAKEIALDVLKEGGLAERMAARRCERHIRNSMLSNIPDWKSIETNPTATICVSIPSPYPDELDYFRNLLADKKLDELIARYPLRDSRVFDMIAGALQLTGKNTYEKTLLSRLKTNARLAQSVRRRIKSLADALD